MDATERLEYGVAFDFLNDAIERGKKMSPIYEYYIRDAQALFGEVAKGLESIASMNRRIPGMLWDEKQVERAKEVLRLYNFDSSKLSGDRLDNIAGYFKGKMQTLGELSTNPEAVYSSVPKKQGLLNVSEKFQQFYAENHPALGEEAKENVEDEYFWNAHGNDGTAD